MTGAAAAPKSSFVADLRFVLAGRDFRRLLTTRLISQTGDGLFTAGLGGYVFFNSNNFPNPASGAAAFAVLYLPYSLIGPFAGVFIDRWSRRQILVISALARSLLVVVAASFIAGGALGVPLYVGVLAVLGVNRFFLSALSAALPHVVAEEKLVTANAVTTTAGGIMAAIGGIAGLSVHVLLHGGRGEYAATMLVAGCCYLLAAVASATMARDLLGPQRDQVGPTHGRILPELASVAAGLAAAGRYVLRRREPTAALVVTGANRFLFGILFLMSILLYRNDFYRSESANKALGHFAVLTAVSAVGYLSAALITPAVTRRLSKPAWIALLLACAAVVIGPLGQAFVQPAFLVIGFCVGLVGQGVAICATTILQEQVDDRYLGRVFAFYDMAFNVMFVGGAALSAVFMPMTGRSAGLIGLVTAGYVVAAAGYWLLGRQPAGPVGGTSSPAASAQRSSS